MDRLRRAQELSITVEEDGNERGSKAMVIEEPPYAMVERIVVSDDGADEVLQHAQPSLQAILDEELAHVTENKEDVAMPLVTIPMNEDMPTTNEVVEDAIQADIVTREKIKFYKENLKVLEELERKKEEHESLRNRATEDLYGDDASVLQLWQAQIESGRTQLAIQTAEKADLEAFYRGFLGQKDLGCSSSNTYAEECLAQYKEACNREAFRITEEKHGVEEARLKLKELEEMREGSPHDRVEELNVSNVVGELEVSPTKIANLKQKLAASLTLEQKLQRSMAKVNLHIQMEKFVRPWIKKKGFV